MNEKSLPPPNPKPVPKKQQGLSPEELDLVFTRFPNLKQTMKGRYNKINIVGRIDVLIVYIDGEIKSIGNYAYNPTTHSGKKIKEDSKLLLVKNFIIDWAKLFRRNWKTISKENIITDDGTKLTIEDKVSVDDD